MQLLEKIVEQHSKELRTNGLRATIIEDKQGKRIGYKLSIRGDMKNEYWEIRWRGDPQYNPDTGGWESVNECWKLYKERKLVKGVTATDPGDLLRHIIDNSPTVARNISLF